MEPKLSNLSREIWTIRDSIIGMEAGMIDGRVASVEELKKARQEKVNALNQVLDEMSNIAPNSAISELQSVLRYFKVAGVNLPSLEVRVGELEKEVTATAVNLRELIGILGTQAIASPLLQMSPPLDQSEIATRIQATNQIWPAELEILYHHTNGLIVGNGDDVIYSRRTLLLSSTGVNPTSSSRCSKTGFPGRATPSYPRS